MAGCSLRTDRDTERTAAAWPRVRKVPPGLVGAAALSIDGSRPPRRAPRPRPAFWCWPCVVRLRVALGFSSAGASAASALVAPSAAAAFRVVRLRVVLGLAPRRAPRRRRPWSLPRQLRPSGWCACAWSLGLVLGGRLGGVGLVARLGSCGGLGGRLSAAAGRLHGRLVGCRAGGGALAAGVIASGHLGLQQRLYLGRHLAPGIATGVCSMGCHGMGRGSRRAVRTTLAAPAGAARVARAGAARVARAGADP